MTIRLLQGKYPPYEKVIPPEYPIKIQLPREPFLKALRKASLLTPQEKSVRLSFEENILTFFSNDPNIGESIVILELEEPVPENLEISFNPVFLMDVLKVLEHENVIMEVKDSESPGVFREDNYLYVLMPLTP